MSGRTVEESVGPINTRTKTILEFDAYCTQLEAEIELLRKDNAATHALNETLVASNAKWVREGQEQAETAAVLLLAFQQAGVSPELFVASLIRAEKLHKQLNSQTSAAGTERNASMAHGASMDAGVSAEVTEPQSRTTPDGPEGPSPKAAEVLTRLLAQYEKCDGPACAKGKAIRAEARKLLDSIPSTTGAITPTDKPTSVDGIAPLADDGDSSLSRTPEAEPHD